MNAPGSLRPCSASDLWPPFGDVGAHDRVGHFGNGVLGAEPVEDPRDRVPLLAWRVQVSDQDLVDHRLEWVELGYSWRVVRAFRRPDGVESCFHGPPPDVVLSLNLSLGQSSPGVAADRCVDLHA
jgi:hypothetical protein